MASAVDDRDDDEPGDERLSALVKMAREDFDEEPPPRLDALLMAAARKHAPQPEVGVFERLRRWLSASMLHPALAGATALVVIGGTAGVLYMKNQGRISQPTVSRPAGPERVQAPEPQPGGELALQLDKLADPEAVPAPVTPEPPPEPRQEPRPRPRGQSTRRLESTTTTSGEGATIATGGVRSDMGGGDGFVARADEVNEAERKPEERSPPPPPPPPPPRDDAVAGAARTENAVTPDADAAPSNRSQAENLHRQARNAAKQRQCAPVKVMAQRAKKLDEDYYSRNIADDPEIKPCL